MRKQCKQFKQIFCLGFSYLHPETRFLISREEFVFFENSYAARSGILQCRTRVLWVLACRYSPKRHVKRIYMRKHESLQFTRRPRSSVCHIFLDEIFETVTSAWKTLKTHFLGSTWQQAVDFYLFSPPRVRGEQQQKNIQAVCEKPVINNFFITGCYAL